MDRVDQEKVGTVIGGLTGRRVLCRAPSRDTQGTLYANAVSHPAQHAAPPRSSGTTGRHPPSLANRTVVLKSPCW